MKWPGIIFMAALLSTAPITGKAQQAQEKPPAPQAQAQEVKAEPAEAAKGFTAAEKKSYEKKTAKELETIQQKIADLRVKATAGSLQMKRLLIRTANSLQIQKIGAGNQLAALEKAAGAAWTQRKAELDKTMESLRKAVEASEAHLK